MVKRSPKQIGTAAETAVMRAAAKLGIPADREPPRGNRDRGDVHLWHGAVVIEVKAGQQTARPSWTQIRGWHLEAETEAARVGRAALPVLVVRRHGSGDAADWHAHVTLRRLLLRLDVLDPGDSALMSMRLGDLLNLLTRHPPHPPQKGNQQ